MSNKLKKYAGAAGMLIGTMLTFEAIAEANLMLMWESIILAIAGACYVFPVKNLINLWKRTENRHYSWPEP